MKKQRPLIFSDEEKENYIYEDDQNLLCWNRYLLMYTQMYIKNFEEKVPGKVGECIFDCHKRYLMNNEITVTILLSIQQLSFSR